MSKRKRSSINDHSSGATKRRKTENGKEQDSMLPANGIEQGSNIMDLPAELVLCIFSQLPVPCLLDISLVCKTWRFVNSIFEDTSLGYL